MERKEKNSLHFALGKVATILAKSLILQYLSVVLRSFWGIMNGNEYAYTPPITIIIGGVCGGALRF